MRAIRCGLGLLVAICFLGAATLSAQTTQTQTLPRGLRNVSGSSSLSVPFNVTATQLWHFVYDSSHFQATGPIVITEVAFRADGLTWGPRTFPQVEVTLASSANDWRNGSYSTTLASNLIAPQVFYSGSQSLPAEASSSLPNPFRLTFSGSTGFRYDPTSGQDFVIVVRTPLAPAGTGSFVVDAQGAGGLATSYGHTSDPNAAVANASQVERAPVVLLSYRSTTGVQVNFDASPRSGRASLAVSFLDRTWTSSPGLASWAWDFENDGVIDSTQQNPQHVYMAPGTYAVALAVTDPLFGAFRIVKPAFISVDPGVAVDFDATPRQGRAYLSVSFTDRSTTTSSGLSSWAWDFENDGVIDSTQQNPTHVYTQAGTYDVALEVSDPLFGSQRLLRSGYVQVDPIEFDVYFTASPRVGDHRREVRFRDRTRISVEGILQYEWDLDGDGIVDSQEPEPTFRYPGPGAYAVTLRVRHAVLGTRETSIPGFVRLGGTVHVDLAASGCGQANGSPALPFCTIHEALRVALDGDEVQIAPGVYPEILDLSRSVALVARAAGSVHVLRVRAVGPIVSRIDGLVVNSYQDGLDSGVIVANGSMEILGCSITNNGGFHPYNGPFLGSGAGINVGRGELWVERSVVSSNSTLGPSGGGIQCSYSRLTMVECTVEGNSTSTDFIFACCGPRRGGGVALVSSRAELERVRVRGNSAGGG